MNEQNIFEKKNKKTKNQKETNQSCYSCGKPAIKPSKHWPEAWVCDECNDFQAASNYAHHIETGD